MKFYCSDCGEEGHRKHYCPTLRKSSGELRLRCRSCGERGHNRRTCGELRSNEEAKRQKQSSSSRHCSLCGQSGHNQRTCPELSKMQANNLDLKSQKTYSCSLCLVKGHNVRTCPNKRGTGDQWWLIIWRSEIFLYIIHKAITSIYIEVENKIRKRCMFRYDVSHIYIHV